MSKSDDRRPSDSQYPLRLSVSKTKDEEAFRVGLLQEPRCRKVALLLAPSCKVESVATTSPADPLKPPGADNWRLSPSDGQIVTTLKIVSIITAAIEDVHDFHLNDRQIVQAVLMWLPYVMADVWGPVLKARKDILFAYALRQEEIPPPWCECCNQTYILPGRAGSALRQRVLYNKNEDNRIFANTILHGLKKGMPKLSEAHVIDGYLKHRERLSTDKGPVDPALRECITRTCREIFGGMKFPETTPVLTQNVSSKSSLHSNRSEGGALSEIFSEEDPLEYYGECFTEETGPLSIKTNKFAAMEKLGQIRERTARVLRSDEGSKLSSHWQTQAILEPLKCRMITKGELRWNAAWSDIQKEMFRRLGRYEQFKLTRGHEIEKQDSLMFQVSGDPLDLDGDQFYVAGDFSAATDELKADATRAAIEGFTDPVLRNLLTVNLLNGLINYPPKYEIDPVHQANGQLMGSIFSFPLLCAINLAIYRYTWESRDKSGFRKPIDSLPVLINGDDIAFRTTRWFYEDWKKNSAEAGLIASRGKCYFTKKFFLVNSRLIHSTPTGILTQAIPYVNYGLVTGQKKGEGDDDLARSRREKLACLEGALRDLSKDFDERSEILKRATARAMKRGDIRISGISKTQLGLPSVEIDDDEARRYLTYASRIRDRGQKEPSAGHTGLAPFIFKFPRVKTFGNLRTKQHKAVDLVKHLAMVGEKKEKRAREEEALMEVLSAQRKRGFAFDIGRLPESSEEILYNKKRK
ncbi:RNA-dependent RNA polymerase [Beihai narna-like virus 12]|uniref:RNA-dependent RNA polymerase n=1 Tax=Beihai narna-like virus 12 TaxID=1922439 RepID=UPI00090B7E46|nr:RNA-dependent RNA polymerase [Beihai narna-like virus 12]APG77082.1 RNA-dependent RNA polymerase [Beihai narna-like virus 12]